MVVTSTIRTKMLPAGNVSIDIDLDDMSKGAGTVL
jgi:hypothetical protein